MNNYFEIQYRTKESTEKWVPTSLVAKNKYGSYEEACEATRDLIYKERIRARRDKSRFLVEFRVVERVYTYTENPLKVFPIQESIFV